MPAPASAALPGGRISKSSLTEAARGDVRLLMTVGNLWGADSLSRIQFVNGSLPCSRTGAWPGLMRKLIVSTKIEKPIAK